MFFNGKNEMKFVLAILPIACCVIWQFIVGKDLNWDASNYHFYAGFSAINDRFSQDFFAAGPQNYLNPFAYVPFYLLVTHSPSALFVGLTLAVSHSTVIYLTWNVVKSVLKEVAASNSFLILTTILSLSTTVVWHQIGSSFIDIYVTIFVLAGVNSLLKYNVSPTVNRSLISALFLGIAVGVKLTSGMFALSAAVCAFFLMCIKHKNYNHFACFAIAGVVGTLLVEGWWGYQVYEQTGNPFFPFLNNIFCSPYVICESITHYRFIPSSLLEAFTLPFEMLLPSPWLYIEILSPDVRFAFLFIALPIFFYLGTRGKNITSSFAVLLSFWLISYFLWLFLTTNGRYGMPLFILVGVVLGYIIVKSLDEKRANIYMSLIVIFQITLLVLGGEFRYSPQKWDAPYFEYQLPDKLTNFPALYITTSEQSNSFLIPQYHPDSSFISVSGKMPLNGESAFNKIEQLANHHNYNVRFFTEIKVPEKKQISDFNWIKNFNSKLERFGWEIKEDRCHYIKNMSNISSVDVRYIADCAIDKNVALAASFRVSAKEVNTIFNNVEKYCPHLLTPSTGVTEKVGGAWVREYMGSDTTIFVTNIKVFKRVSNEKDITELGNRKDWTNAPISASKACMTETTKRSKSVKFSF